MGAHLIPVPFALIGIAIYWQALDQQHRYRHGRNRSSRFSASRRRFSRPPRGPTAA